jgi:uncharacterized membrane protein
MDSSELQQLLSSQGNSQDTTIGQINSTINSLMPLLQLSLIIGAILTIIVVIYFVVNIIQKQRQHAAIMRIDKNLQRLVDHQIPATASEEHEKPADNSPQHDIEQK